MKRMGMVGLCLVAVLALSASTAISTRCAHLACGRAAALPAGAYAEFPLAPGSRALQITAGPDGNLWFTESNKVGRITPSGTITEFPLASPCAERAEACLGGITAGPDGNLWFTGDWLTDQQLASEIGRITPGGTITEFPLALAGENFVYPVSIAAGPDGNLWFDGGRITPSGTITKFPRAEYGAITAGPDGNLWATEPPTESAPRRNKIGRIAPNGTVTRFSIPTCCAGGITAGPDGNMWFTANLGTFRPASIGRISPAGRVSLFPLPLFRLPEFIAAGPDGNLWFTDLGLGNSVFKIGRITPSGAVNEFPLPTSRPVDIAAGPDGKLWFVEASDANSHQAGSTKIARVDPRLLPPPSAEECVVPRVTGNTVLQAAKPISRANCRFGRITRRGKVLDEYNALAAAHKPRIVSQSPRPHTTLGFAAKVSVRLG